VSTLVGMSPHPGRVVLSNPVCRENARRVQQAMQTLPTPQEDVPLLERLAMENAQWHVEVSV
jgi:hypothetical protein